MTNKEKEILKKEIIAEVLHELKNKGLTSAGNEQFDFDQYKLKVVEDDIKKVESFINSKFKWQWFIPIFGIFISLYHVQQVVSSIDRGQLKVKINKASLSWIFVTILAFYPSFIFNLMPFINKRIFKKAIKLAKYELAIKIEKPII